MCSLSSGNLLTQMALFILKLYYDRGCMEIWSKIGFPLPQTLLIFSEFDRCAPSEGIDG